MTRSALLSPLPPTPTGVAEYTRDLAPSLAGLQDLTLYAPSPAAHAIDGVPVRDVAAFDADRDPALVTYYQMGNNAHHHFVAERAWARPGVLVLHDLVLHHYFIEQTLAQDDEQGYLALLEESYGREGRALGLGRVHGICSDLQQFVHPLFERLVTRSRGVIVHNQRARRLIHARFPRAAVAVVPMGMPSADEDPLPERARARRDLGFGDDEFLVGVFGFLTPMKRPEIIAAAFTRLLRSVPRARLLVVGEVSRVVDLNAMFGERGVRDLVTFTGYVSEAGVRQYMAAADVFVNLRYPTAGETSASLLRLMGWGKPVVVSDFGQFRELPEGAVFHLPLADDEDQALAALLVRLAADPAECRRVGEAAAAFVKLHHTREQAAKLYAAFGEGTVAAPMIGPPTPIRAFAPTSRVPARMVAEMKGSPLPRRVSQGQPQVVDLELKNTGDTVWLHRWDHRGGYVTVRPRVETTESWKDYLFGHKNLPHDVHPGERVRVAYAFEAPELPGPYRLIVDLYDMGCLGWFAERGSERLIYEFEVVGPHASAGSPG